MGLFVDDQANYVDVSAVDVCTGGSATALKSHINASPTGIKSKAGERLQKAQEFVRLISDLNSATQSLQSAWSGEAAESAVQKLMSTASSFFRIVDAMQQGAAILEVSADMIGGTQTAYKGVFSWVNPTVARALSSPWTWEFGQALASGSVSSMSTYVMGVQAALQALGAGKTMQQVAVLASILMEIEQLAQGNSNAASEASAIIGLYRAGRMEYKIQNPTQSSQAVGSCPAPAPAPSSLSQAVSSPQGDMSDAFAGDA